MKGLFSEKDGEKRLVSIGGNRLKNHSRAEVIEFSESELNELIPDSFEETDWKEVRRHYKLVDGELVFDKGYEPDEEE